LSCISYLKKDSEDKRLEAKLLKFRIIQNMIRSSDQCIHSSKPRQKILRSTHLCARTSDDLIFADSGLFARADSLVARANLGEFLVTSLFSFLVCLKVVLLIPNHITTHEARIEGYIKDLRAILIVSLTSQVLIWRFN